MDLITVWLNENETALSALAALVVIVGVVLSPLGAGMRGLLSRNKKADAVSVDTLTTRATTPAAQDLLTTPPPLITDKPSIAVLPFVNMSDDKSQEYFADGMTEDIITGLSCDSRLFVIARNSTFAYKGQSPDIRTVGKELGVRYVLEGSIRPVGDRLRITVQLIETETGSHVWADKIDRPQADIFDIMDEMVDGLVTALCSNLGMAEGNRAARQRPEDLQSWGLCVQAETIFFSQPSPQSMATAEKLLRIAIDAEPGYGASWGLLAYMVSLRPIFGVSSNPSEDVEQTISLADKAMSLAPRDPLVLGYSGIGYIWSGLTTQAVDCLERSLDMNPNNSVFRLFYGAALNCDGQPAPGIEQLQLFFNLSPKDPNIGMGYFFCSYCYISLGDFARAEQWARKAVKLLPGFAWSHMALATALGALGHHAEAQQHARNARKLSPGWTLAALDDFWQLVLRRPEDAEKYMALTRQVWTDQA